MEQSRHLEVRPLTADDLAAVLEIQWLCHDASRIESAQSFDAKRQASPTSCFVASLDGRSVGYLVAIPAKAGQPPPLNGASCPVPRDADALYLHDLAVHPEARAAGVAVALVRAFFDALGRQGFSQACLTAVNGSTAFWQRQGFRGAMPDAAAAGGMASYGEGAQYMNWRADLSARSTRDQQCQGRLLGSSV